MKNQTKIQIQNHVLWMLMCSLGIGINLGIILFAVVIEQISLLWIAILSGLILLFSMFYHERKMDKLIDKL